MSPERSRFEWRLPLPWVVLVLSLAATALASWALERSTRTRDQVRFDNAVEAASDIIRARIDAYVNLLRGSAAFFTATASDGIPTGEQFRTYWQRLRVSRDYPGIQGFGFSARVPAAEKEAFEARMRSALSPGFRIWPDHPRDEYHSIIYLEPLDRRNLAAIGYDMYTNAVRREAMAAARDRGQRTMSGPVTLVQEIDPQKQAGFLIYVPVYRSPVPPPTVAERRANLIGFAYAPFRAGDLFQNVFGAENDPRIAFGVYDGRKVDPATLLHDNRGGAARTPGRFTATVPIEAAGREWTILFESTPAFETGSSGRLVFPAVAFGVVFSALLFAITLAQQTARFRAEENERVVRRRTAALETLNRVAKTLAAELDVEKIVQTVTDAATELSGAQFGAFFYNVVNERGESYMLYTISGVPREKFSRFPMPRNTAVFDPTFSGSRIVRSDDIRKDPRYGKSAPHYGMPAGHLPVVSYLAVPVFSRTGDVLGGLFFGHEKAGVFDADSEEIVSALAAHGAVAIDNGRLFASVRRNERRYATLLLASSLRMSIWSATRDGRFLERSPSWEELTGQTYEQMSGFGWLDAVHGSDRDMVRNAWNDSVSAGSPFSVECRVQTREGTYRWCTASAFPMRNDERGEIEEWIGTTTDIHDRKLAEETLLAREKRYRAHVEASATPQAFWTTDPEGNVIEDSLSWRNITGQTFEEWRGKGGGEAIHPEDRERVRAAWRASLSAKTIWDVDYRIRQSDGTYRWFRTKGVPIMDESGAIVEWVGTSTDVHDRRLAQERLEFLARASELLSVSLDYEQTLRALAQQTVPRLADWCVVDIVEDGELQRLAAWHSDPEKVALAEELMHKYPPRMTDGRGPANVVRTGQPEHVADLGDEMLQQAAQDEEHLRILRSLGLRSFLCVPISVRGRVAGVITMISAESRRKYTSDDVQLATELARRAAQAIDNARLYREVVAASRAKDDFLATLSHELRTPMTAILGWASMLNRDLDAETFDSAVATIRRSAQAQAQLIDDVLDVSRITTGRLQLNAGPVDVSSVIREALQAVRPAAEAKGIHLSLIEHAAHVVVHADAARLQQIFWNIAANAIKFTPPGGRVTAEISRAGSDARVSMRDSGEGIAPDFLPYVFDPFRQGDQTMSRAHGGLGLGLAIVRYLTEAHGGRVSASSEGPGKGATFTVELPMRAAPHAEPSASTLRTRADRSGAFPDLRGRKILVVDDQADARELVAAVLERCGADVRTAASARAGAELFASYRPDVLVSDIAMPGEDGYQLLQLIRDTVPGDVELRAIALTAFGRPEDREMALSAGFADYLKKPIDPHVLADAIRRQIQS